MNRQQFLAHMDEAFETTPLDEIKSFLIEWFDEVEPDKMNQLETIDTRDLYQEALDTVSPMPKVEVL